MAQYFIRNESYPPIAGQRLYHVVASLPPQTRRMKIRFPLLPISQCLQLCSYASTQNSEDVWLFFKACSGELTVSHTGGAQKESGGTPISTNDSLSPETIISEIEADNITSTITVKIDNARASYMMNSVIVSSHEVFYEHIAAYYVHLSRHTHDYSGAVDLDAAGAEALEILERAFANKGGFNAALAEARQATNGGMRYVLDVFTEQYKREQKEKYVSRIFKLAMDPLDWEGKVKFMESVISRLKHILPLEITNQPAERFAIHFEPIVRALNQARDELASVFKKL